jgi:hypothetical protein
MSSDLKWSTEEWRRLQTSLFAVTGSTRIKVSDLNSRQWEQVVKDTGRTKEDIMLALNAMIRRQQLPGGRVPVQTTEKLFKDAVPHIQDLLHTNRGNADGAQDTARSARILEALRDFNISVLRYDDLFHAWNLLGSTQGLLRQHECLRCVYSVLGQITQTKAAMQGVDAMSEHRSAQRMHCILNPPRLERKVDSASSSNDDQDRRDDGHERLRRPPPEAAPASRRADADRREGSDSTFRKIFTVKHNLRPLISTVHLLKATFHDSIVTHSPAQGHFS